MNKITKNIVWVIFWGSSLTACHPTYEVTKVVGKSVAIDSQLDAEPDSDALALLAPYKQKVDSVMQQVVGVAAHAMDRQRPESPLSNLIADVLRKAAVNILNKEADMGLVNIGGIRTSLNAGNITIENIYEILPFENSLCVLTLKGSVLKLLFENIAAKGGEGVSGIQLGITRNGKILKATVGGKPIEDERYYTVATIDYLAEGNDGMTVLPQAEIYDCPQGATLRSLFMKYVEQETEAGRKLTAHMEGRIRIIEQ